MKTSLQFTQRKLERLVYIVFEQYKKSGTKDDLDLLQMLTYKLRELEHKNYLRNKKK